MPPSPGALEERWWQSRCAEGVRTVAAGKGPAPPAVNGCPSPPPNLVGSGRPGRGLLVCPLLSQVQERLRCQMGLMAARMLAMPSRFAGLSRSRLGPGAQHREFTKWQNWARNSASGNPDGQPLHSRSNLLNFKLLRQYHMS